MWKKAAWIYVGIYLIGVTAFNVNSMIKSYPEQGFNPSSLLLLFLFLVPGALVILELIGMLKGKFFALFHIVALLFVAIMVLGIFNFNTVGLEMFAKALLFIPMLGCLGYYIYIKLFQMKKPTGSA